MDNKMTDNMINNKYIIENIIGKGQFGCIYKGFHKKTKEPVAIKIELSNSPIKLLKNETTILSYLYNNGSRCIPQIHWYGLFSNNTCLIMSLYDHSLYDLIQKKELSISQIKYIIMQCIDIIENIHKNYVLHRDIKPQNFMIKNNELFIIDFGFSTFYIDHDKNHIPIKNDQQNIIGTPKYISIYVHNGIHPSRRDDLISIGYIFLYLCKRELPWEKIPNLENKSSLDVIDINHPKNKYIYTLKQIENIEKCLLDKDNKRDQPMLELEQSLLYYLKYCYSLKYEEEPFYHSLKQIFTKNDLKNNCF